MTRNALTVADRRQKSNPYALAHYCGIAAC